MMRWLAVFAMCLAVGCSSDSMDDPSDTVSFSAGDPQPEPEPQPQAASGLVDRTWTLVEFDGKAPAFAGATVRFEKSRAFASSTCNGGQGTYRRSGNASGSLQFRDLGVTERGCNPPLHTFEDAYFGALFEVKDFAIAGKRLTLTGGGPVMVFEAP